MVTERGRKELRMLETDSCLNAWSPSPTRLPEVKAYFPAPEFSVEVIHKNWPQNKKRMQNKQKKY